MSVVTETKREIALGKIPARIALYEQLIDAAEVCFQLTDRKLEDACKGHANDLMTYDMMLQECKTIEETIRGKIETLESEIYKSINESNKRALGTTEIKLYVKCDPQWIAANEILLEVVHTKRRLDSIVEALKSMGWSLGHIVKLRIAQLENTVL